MSAKYSCIVRLKNDSNGWNIDGNVESCINQLNELGREWECIIIENSKTHVPVAVMFPFDEGLFE